MELSYAAGSNVNGNHHSEEYLGVSCEIEHTLSDNSLALLLDITQKNSRECTTSKYTQECIVNADNI